MADRVGQQLGNYRLVRLLGKGNFAKVFLGEHLHLGTQAAIKVLFLGLGNDEEEDFRTEARIIARLVHPHIVRVLDFGIEGTTPFLVMDYAPGGTLRKLHPKRNRLPLETVLSYVMQIAPALQYAHTHNVIHRDIKPENMLVGSHHQILLSDFGLAVVASSSRHHSLQEVVGTIAYVAPEQLEGNPCMASDQYALAVVVYEWLCGSLPFRGSHREIAQQHLTAAPPLLRKKVSTLPPAVEQVVLRALAKEPGQRYVSIEAFAIAMQQATSAEELVHGVQVQTAPTHSSGHIGRSQQSQMIGREQQLEVLRQLLSETEQKTRTPPGDHKTAPTLSFDTPSRAPCILLLGEVGIGKTRLAEEVSREAQQRGWAVIWSRAHTQEHSMPYQLWIEVLRNAMSEGHVLQSEVRQHPVFYQPLVTLLPELTDLLPQEAVSSAAPPEQVQLRLRETMLSLLTTVGESAPLLIVLDDLHWADLSSCELLGYLIRRLFDHRLLLMATCRERELPPTHPLRILLANLQRERAVTTLHIPRLNDAQIGTLVGHLPGPLTESIVQYIQNQAAGNPFFAEELARGVGAQFIAPNAEAQDTAGTTNQLHLPPNLTDTISAVLDLRMGRISAACQRLLVRAAVLGGSFAFNTIRSIEAGSSDADEDAILDLLEEALQAGMLTEEGSGTRITYHFWHPLLVSYLYDGLSAGRRANLHRRAAEVLRQTYQGREAEGAATIAYHLVKGGADSPQIAHYAEVAGERAYALSAYPEAVQHYRLAVEQRGTLHADASGEEQLHLANLLERLGECTRVQGNYQQARSFFEQALEVHTRYRLAASHLDPQYEAQIEALLWCEIGRTWYDAGDNVHAQHCYGLGEQALREAKVEGGPTWANLYLQQSFVLLQEGSFEEARQTAHLAQRIFEHVLREQHRAATHAFHSTATRRTLEGDPVDLGRTHRLLAAIAATVGQSTIALDHLNTALAIFEQYDRQLEIAHICCNIGDVYLRKGEHMLAQAALRRSMSIAERIGDASIMSAAFGNLGILAARLGDLPEAEACFKRGITLAEQVNDPVYMSLCHAYLTTVMQDQGNINEAKVFVCQALTIGRAKNFTPCIGIALVVLGQLRLAQALVMQENDSGSPGTIQRPANSTYTYFLRRARISLQRALALEGLEAETRTEGQLALAKVAFLLGEIDEAQQQAVQVMNEAQRYEQTWLLACAQRLMGSILSAVGQREQANEYFEQAIETFHHSGMRLEWARTLQNYGLSLLEQYRKGDTGYEQGLKNLQDACQSLRECHATFDLQGVERILTRYTAPAVPSERKSTRQAR